MPEFLTVRDALATLAQDGYIDSFSVQRDNGQSVKGNGLHAARDLVAERIYRFEGESDPDDEAIVVGLRCPRCGAKGVVVAAYGPMISREEAEFLEALR